jgi:hypothetical protein
VRVHVEPGTVPADSCRHLLEGRGTAHRAEDVPCVPGGQDREVGPGGIASRRVFAGDVSYPSSARPNQSILMDPPPGCFASPLCRDSTITCAEFGSNPSRRHHQSTVTPLNELQRGSARVDSRSGEA